MIPDEKMIEASDMGSSTDRPPVQAKDLQRTLAGGGMKPEHYQHGKITRAGMEHVIRNGGSVLVHTEAGPRLLIKESDIPPALAAMGTPEDRQAELDRIAERRRELDEQEKTLKGTTTPLAPVKGTK